MQTLVGDVLLSSLCEFPRVRVTDSMSLTRLEKVAEDSRAEQHKSTQPTREHRRRFPHSYGSIVSVSQ